MQVKLTDLELQEHIEKALIASISEESRNRMINDALQYLVTPARDSWSAGKSPLQIAFQNAVESAAAKHIQEEIENQDSDFHKLLVDIIKKAIDKMRDADSYNTISEKFASALAKVFEPKY